MYIMNGVNKSKTSTDYCVEMSAQQESPYGKLLNNFYYSNTTLCDLAPGRHGFPHNGGEHTLFIKGSYGDVKAFLDLMIEEYTQVKYSRLIREGVQELIELRDQLVCMR